VVGRGSYRAGAKGRQSGRMGRPHLYWPPKSLKDDNINKLTYANIFRVTPLLVPSLYVALPPRMVVMSGESHVSKSIRISSRLAT
jgi:hypothetical protein